MTKIEALAKHLDTTVENIGENTDDTYSIEDSNEEYLVLTNKEADEKAKEYILDSLWAFKASFLASHSGIDEDVIQAIQANDKCEDNNQVFLKLIEDVDHFVNDAILSDARGHFLSNYDGEEHEEGEFYIYRTN